MSEGRASELLSRNERADFYSGRGENMNTDTNSENVAGGQHESLDDVLHSIFEDIRLENVQQTQVTPINLVVNKNNNTDSNNASKLPELNLIQEPVAPYSLVQDLDLTSDPEPVKITNLVQNLPNANAESELSSNLVIPLKNNTEKLSEVVVNNVKKIDML